MLNSYYILVPVPIVIIIATVLIFYFLGIRLPPAFLLGIFLSLISVILIHPFSLDDQNKLIPQEGDFYASIYILLCIVSMIVLIIWIICTNRGKTCCEKTTDSKLFFGSYEQVDSIEPWPDRIVIESPDFMESPNSIEGIDDVPVVINVPPNNTDSGLLIDPNVPLEVEGTSGSEYDSAFTIDPRPNARNILPKKRREVTSNSFSAGTSYSPTNFNDDIKEYINSNRDVDGLY